MAQWIAHWTSSDERAIQRLWVRIPPESVLFYFFFSSLSGFFLKGSHPSPPTLSQLVSVPTSASALLSSLLTCLPRVSGRGEQDWGRETEGEGKWAWTPR